MGAEVVNLGFVMKAKEASEAGRVGRSRARRVTVAGSPREMAAHQRRTRAQHAQERAQDYVEAIADLIARRGEARATDLARAMGVTHVTVIRTVQRLQKEGLVTTEPYRSIFLTDAGRRMATKVRARHETVIAFLLALGVPEPAARADAEGIEHHVSGDTLAAFERYLASEPREPPSRTRT